MRKLNWAMMVSLDGFIAGPRGEINWHHADQEHALYAEKMLGTVDTILLGRVTYELMAAYWPEQTRTDSPIADLMNKRDKVVFSSSLKNLDWQNSRLTRESAVAAVAKLKQQPGKDMVLLGSATLAAALINQNLIDEYQFLLNPVALGTGQPLFLKLDQPRNFRLVSCKTRCSGVVELHYCNASTAPMDKKID